jgi:hypothetical protein
VAQSLDDYMAVVKDATPAHEVAPYIPGTQQKPPLAAATPPGTYSAASVITYS